MKAIFKVKTLDKDTRIEYPASDVAVEVSDAFAERLKAHDPKGLIAQFEDVDYDKEIQELDSLLDKASKEEIAEVKREIVNTKAHIDGLNSQIETLKEEKEAILNERSHFETKLSEANDYIAELNETITKLSASPKEESKVIEVENKEEKSEVETKNTDDSEKEIEAEVKGEDSLFGIDNESALEPKKAGRPKKTDD